jgi:acyl-CoA hydrolase
MIKNIIEEIEKVLSSVSSFSKENITNLFIDFKDLLIQQSILTEKYIEVEKTLKNHKVKNFESCGTLEEMFSHIVMHSDLNPAETMYGGRMLELCDEAGCIFLFKKTGVRRLVTTEMQNVYFLCSPKLGDIVTFYGEILEVRKASVWIRILAKNITTEGNPTVIDTQMRFMLLDKVKK